MTRRFGKTRALELLRASATNRRQIDSWLWIARHQIRQGDPRRACEAMLSALWLLGVETP